MFLVFVWLFLILMLLFILNFSLNVLLCFIQTFVNKSLFSQTLSNSLKPQSGNIPLIHNILFPMAYLFWGCSVGGLLFVSLVTIGTPDSLHFRQKYSCEVQPERPCRMPVAARLSDSLSCKGCLQGLMCVLYVCVSVCRSVYAHVYVLRNFSRRFHFFNQHQILEIFCITLLFWLNAGNKLLLCHCHKALGLMIYNL